MQAFILFFTSDELKAIALRLALRLVLNSSYFCDLGLEVLLITTCHGILI